MVLLIRFKDPRSWRRRTRNATSPSGPTPPPPASVDAVLDSNLGQSVAQRVAEAVQLRRLRQQGPLQEILIGREQQPQEV